MSTAIINNNALNNFSSMVFSDRTMRERLPKDVYKSLKRTMEQGKSIDPNIAGVVANAMKDWALSKGVTHYTHWFQPMTGITAEKHDSFISPAGDGGIIMEFSGKELIQGEPDASSFPSGGLRATFEARGYTAWDPTSYAFIKEGTLCIPTAFCSYGGEALDKKTPLLRSMETINRESLRILKLLGRCDVRHVTTTVGPEQEYFLIDKQMYRSRRDLQFCGRTLFGAKPPKGQELDDHYFGAIKPRVLAFMQDLNRELWELGILAKTEHNEVAPAQHELAPIFSTTNIATDHNQLTMEMMKKVADHHGLVCLLHEKPFAGVNGSGKHNNWSLSTDSGENLLDPTDKPEESLQFLLFLVAVIKAVDDYQDLLRVSVATAGNDHRLGANEAPPAIISMFVGDDLAAVLDAVETGFPLAHSAEKMRAGVKTLPSFKKDTTDRNRTSPFAFTGNKFEFRMPGSSLSIAGPNFVLNTIVAESLKQFADRLDGSDNIVCDAMALVRDTVIAHKRIVFNGNNYAQEWVEEAERRGLLNLKTTVDALPTFISEKNIKLFTSHGILTESEMRSRYEIILEGYCKTIAIESLTMLEMTSREIIPAISAYVGHLSEAAARKMQVCPDASLYAEKELITKLSALLESIYTKSDALEAILQDVKNCGDDLDCQAGKYRNNVLAAMQELRTAVDEAEPLVGKSFWPMPDYGDLLFGV
ncbi:MAG: glutamine synthetase III [Oscillospiraceae bacterium]